VRLDRRDWHGRVGRKNVPPLVVNQNLYRPTAAIGNPRLIQEEAQGCGVPLPGRGVTLKQREHGHG